MRMTKIRIRNFRSIQDITIPLEPFTVFCGPNSCGKSNIFRAVQLAFKENISADDAQNNLPTTLINSQGAPNLSIWVDCDFANVSKQVQELISSSTSEITYSFRLYRRGTVTRKLGSENLDQSIFAAFLDLFSPIYVPPIRDLNVDGLLPFRQLLKSALQRAKGPDSIRTLKQSAQKIIEKKGSALLNKKAGLAQQILRSNKLSLDMSSIDIDTIFENIDLRVDVGSSEQPLSALGTGHQSAVIMSLYRQLGEELPGQRLYLFEEPDNHLHPTTIRAMCDELGTISESSQVMASTHSPVFLSYVDVAKIRPLIQKNDPTKKADLTTLRDISILQHYTTKQIRFHLDHFGLKLVEPLLCNRVIIVEGATDKIVLSTLFDKRRGYTTDQRDLIVVAAGGKEQVVTLSHILDCLNVDWHCVLDRDAAYSSEIALLKRNLSTNNLTHGVSAVTQLINSIDQSSRRGKNAVNQLNAINNELTSGSPTPQLYQSSVLQKLMKKLKLLDAQDERDLKNYLETRNSKRKERELLRKANVTLWSADLEHILLNSDQAKTCVEQTLIAHNVLQRPLQKDQNYDAALRNRLHELANMPEILSAIVLSLEDGGHFSRTEINTNFDFIFPL